MLCILITIKKLIGQHVLINFAFKLCDPRYKVHSIVLIESYVFYYWAPPRISHVSLLTLPMLVLCKQRWSTCFSHDILFAIEIMYDFISGSERVTNSWTWVSCCFFLWALDLSKKITFILVKSPRHTKTLFLLQNKNIQLSTEPYTIVYFIFCTSK